MAVKSDFVNDDKLWKVELARLHSGELFTPETRVVYFPVKVRLGEEFVSKVGNRGEELFEPRG